MTGAVIEGEMPIHTRDGECLHCTAQNEIIGEGKTMKTEAAKVPDVLAPYVTGEGEGIRLNPRGADGLTIAVLVLPTAKYDSWHTMLPKILDRAPKSSFGTSYRLFFLVKDVPDGTDTSIRDNEVIMFLGGYGSPFLIGDWIGELPDELPIITYAEVETLMGIRDRDPKPEAAQNAPAVPVRRGKTKKRTPEDTSTAANLPKTEPEGWWEDIHRKVARGELKVEDATTTEAGPKILELVATKAAETAAKRGVPYDEFVTPDKLRLAFGFTDAYQVCCSEDADIDPIITTAIEVGRQKYDELSKTADNKNPKIGLDDVLALDSENGLKNSAAELVVVDVEEPNVKALPPWKREIVINAKFEDCGVARAFNRHRHTFDDEGNANRFEDECGEWVRFDKSSKQWIIWKAPDGTKQKIGNHWEPADELLKQAARFVGRSVSAEKGKWADPQNDTIAKQFDKHANHSANHRTQNDMLAMAAANMTVDLRKATNPHLIACRNGIFDSKNGEFYPLKDCEQFKTQYPTVYIDAEYIPDARSEKWIEHLNTVMTDNTTEGLPTPERDNRRDKLVEYLLRLFGYGLYVGNPERIFVCFYGDGRNGKSTTTETVTAVLDGQTGKPALSQIFSTKEDRAAPSVAAALPKRFAFFTELGGTGKIDVAMVKELTGETETERFRGMGKDNEKLPIYCLPIATTNESPQFDKEVDDALLTRLIIIPFKHRFEGEKHDVLSELVAEKDKIFSMMVDECIKCRKREASGEKFLPVPDCAKMTGKELLVGSDRYLFLTTILEPTDGKAETDRMNRKEITECYLKWAEGVGIEVSTQPDKDGNKVLTKSERNKLFGAMKIFEYTEAKIKGTRYFRVRRKTE